MKQFAKKLLYLTLCMCLIFSTLAIPAFAAGETYELCYEFDQDAYYQGETITANLVLKRTDSSEGFNLYAFSVDVGFMPLYLEYKGCASTYSDFRISGVSNYNVYYDQVRIAYHGLGNKVDCDNHAVLATLTFQAKSEIASTTLKLFLPEVYTQPGVKSGFTVFDGAITIGEAQTTYPVGFFSGGGIGTAPTVGNKAAGNQFTLPPNTFIRPGYIFAGWSDGENIYQPGDIYTMPARAVTFIAQWTKNEYTISFSGGSGTTGNPPGSVQWEAGTVIALPGSGTLAKPNHSFVGWSYKGQLYQPGDKFTVPEEDVVFVAVWKEIVDAGGGGAATQTVILPLSGDEKTINVEAKIVGKEALLQFDIAKLNTVLDENIKTGIVTIDLTVLGKDISSVVIPNAALKAISAAANSTGNDVTGLAIKLTDGTIKFDAKAQASIASRAGEGNLRLFFDETGTKGLNSAQVAALQDNRPLAVYDIYMTANGKRISNLDGGTAEVTVRHKLAPGQKTQGIAVLYVADDGAKTPLQFTVKGDAVVFTVTHFSNYVITYISEIEGYKVCPKDSACPIARFFDTAVDEWWHDGIHFCLENGLMVGVENSEFNPNGTTTRAMIVTILWRMEGRPVSSSVMSFKDVAVGQWYTEAIRWSQETGIVFGYNASTFGPDDDITREQLAAILYRYASYKGIDVSARSSLDGFTDLGQISSWALDNIKWANAVEIIKGRTASTIVPQGTATRAEAANMIQRFYENVLK